MLNNVVSTDQLLDFRLGARIQIPDPTTGVETSSTHASEGHEMDTDEPPIPKEPLVSKGSMQQLLVRFDLFSSNRVSSGINLLHSS